MQPAAVHYWCATFNNYTAASYEAVRGWMTENCTYAVIGKEVAETGTPHLQCYFALHERKRRTFLSKVFDDLGAGKPHLEATKANGKVASEYCKKGKQSHDEWDAEGAKGPNFGKDADVFEHGVLPIYVAGNRGSATASAKRTADYAAAIELAKQRKFNEIDPGMLVRHYGNFQRIAADNPPQVNHLERPNAEWIWGPPGTGKSYTARKENPVFYWKGCNKWWCGYKGEEVVIIDDFDLNHKVLGHHLKIWLDEYAFGAEIKGSSMIIRPRKIVITSNYDPRTIWSDDPTLADAIMRRITMRWMSEKYVRSDEAVEGAHANFVRATPDLVSDSPPVPTPPPRDNHDFGLEFSDSQVMFLDNIFN